MFLYILGSYNALKHASFQNLDKVAWYMYIYTNSFYFRYIFRILRVDYVFSFIFKINYKLKYDSLYLQNLKHAYKNY